MNGEDKHPVVRLIAMGGTIAFDAGAEGAIPSLHGGDLAGVAVGGIAIDPIDLAQISSIGLRDHHLLALSTAVRESVAQGYAGIVITHGTDTLEESAYFLALTCAREEVPIVLTGAMRHHGLPSPDGPANLRAALAAATTPGMAQAGPVVVMHDEIHAARFVTKVHATRLAAFGSPLAGPIGHVVEGRAALWFVPHYTDFVGVVAGHTLPRVELITMAVGVEPMALRAIVNTAPDGIVIEGFGGGHVAPQVLEVVDEMVAQGIPTVIASRCGDGPTLRDTYGVPGTEIDVQRRGALMAGALSPLKARLRLAVGLATGIPARDIFPVVD